MTILMPKTKSNRQIRYHIRFSSHYTWCDMKIGWRVFLAGQHAPTCQTCIKREAKYAAETKKPAVRDKPQAG